MQKITVMLEYFFNYILVTILEILALLLIFPFTLVYALSIAYFNEPADGRSLKNIFRAFASEKKNYLLYSLVSTILLVVPILNIRVFNLPSNALSSVILFISWVLLFIGLVFTLFAPVIIIKMRVTFKELIINTILVALRGNILSLLLILGVGAIVLISLYYPLVLIPSIYFITLANYHAVNTIINKIKKEKSNEEENETRV